MAKSNSRIIVRGTGLFEETTTTEVKEVLGFYDLIEAKVAERMADQCTVFRGVHNDNGLSVNMAVWNGRIVFARRFALGPIGVYAWWNKQENSNLSMIGPEQAREARTGWEKVPLVYDEKMFAGLTKGEKAPEHWLTYNAQTNEMCLVLYYNGNVYHPLLPNVYGSGKVCTGNSYSQELSDIMTDKPGATIFDKFRAAFNNVTRSPWNDDLQGDGFCLIRYGKKGVTPINLAQVKQISHADHVKELFG